MAWRNGLVQWVAAFAISIALNLPRQLNRHHHASHRVSVQVFAAVAVIVLFAAAIRLVFFVIGRFSKRRGSDGERPGDAGAAGTQT
jgi:hypothetical protein